MAADVYASIALALKALFEAELNTGVEATDPLYLDHVAIGPLQEDPDTEDFDNTICLGDMPRGWDDRYYWHRADPFPYENDIVTEIGGGEFWSWRVALTGQFFSHGTRAEAVEQRGEMVQKIITCLKAHPTLDGLAAGDGAWTLVQPPVGIVRALRYTMVGEDGEVFSKYYLILTYMVEML